MLASVSDWFMFLPPFIVVDSTRLRLARPRRPLRLEELVPLSIRRLSTADNPFINLIRLDSALLVFYERLLIRRAVQVSVEAKITTLKSSISAAISIIERASIRASYRICQARISLFVIRKLLQG